MADNLPVELLSEITSHLSDCPASLDGLQVGLTCKELYKEFRPIIRDFYRRKLLDEYENGGIKILAQGREPDEEQIDLEEFKFNLDLAVGIGNPGAVGTTQESSARQKPFDFEFWLMYCPTNYDVDAFWSLISLISGSSVVQNMSILVFGILPALASPDAEMRVKRPTARWARALMKLFEVHTKREESKLIIYWDPLAALPTSAWASISPSDLPAPDWTNFLTNVGLSGPIDLPIWDLLLLPIFRRTSSISTELHISDCHNAPRHFWIDFLNSLWDLPHLTTFEVVTSTIPIRLETDPENSDASAIQGRNSTEAATEQAAWARPPTCASTGHFLPNLRTLGATINLLLLFAEGNIYFPKLVELIIQESNRQAIVGFGDLTRAIAYTASHFPHIQTLMLDLPYSAELSAWLQSTSASKPPASRYAMLPTFLGALQQVTTLNIHLAGRQGHGDNLYSLHPKHVASFMAGFPALKTAVLMGVFNVPLEAVVTEEEFWEGVGGMWDSCHRLEELKIHGIGERGIQRNAMEWRKGEGGPTPGIDTYSQYFIPPESS